MATGSAAKLTFLPVILAAALRALSTLPSRTALASPWAARRSWKAWRWMAETTFLARHDRKKAWRSPAATTRSAYAVYLAVVAEALAARLAAALAARALKASTRVARSAARAASVCAERAVRAAI